jgi:aminoglycoside phosphotransferase (APT) family kinase protein
MIETGVNEQQIRAAITRAGLDSTGPIKRISVGFSNDVFDISDQYVFKAAKTQVDDALLSREIFLCNLFRDRVPAPRILASDTSREVIDRTYIIYEKIQGDNLYIRWHKLDRHARRRIIADICSYLRVINEIPSTEYAHAFDAERSDWRSRITSDIRRHLSTACARGLVTLDFGAAIEYFVSHNEALLNQSHVALTYYDAHFDNFIVRGGQIVGMLDFERTDLMSIDYALDIVQRMVMFPNKYASEAAEPLIIADDYAELMTWFQELYPELFQFERMETRLALYSVEHDLKELLEWPNSNRALAELARIVS